MPILAVFICWFAVSIMLVPPTIASSHSPAKIDLQARSREYNEDEHAVLTVKLQTLLAKHKDFPKTFRYVRPTWKIKDWVNGELKFTLAHSDQTRS